jgi:hypothetical protein
VFYLSGYPSFSFPANSKSPDTARFFVGMSPPFDPVEGEEDTYSNPDFDTHERPDDPMHHRNHPARPAVEVLDELVAKFRDLVWIPVRGDDTWPRIISASYAGYEERTIAVC